MNKENEDTLHSVLHKINIKEMRAGYKITAILYLIYAMFMTYVYVHIDAMVPDEQWFLSVVNDITLDGLDKFFKVPNYFGYGSIYWMILKILDDFLAMRLLSLTGIFLVPVSIAYTMKNVLNKDADEINCALLIYLSSPLAWFTGKIIGPEIIGNIIGIVGTIVLIKGKSAKGNINKKFIIGSIIIGIATGIKLYYVTYAVFSYTYILWDYKDNVKESVKNIAIDSFILGIGVIIGFIIANPVIVTDFSIFKENFVSVGEYSIIQLTNVFFREGIEWDLVNSGGLTKMVISLIGIIGVFISAFLLDRRLFCAGICSFCFLILVCCSKIILGWYLLPLVFIIPICFCKIRFRYYIVILNLLFMLSPTVYQIAFKCEQISNISNELSIVNEAKKWESVYEGYQPYYFIEPCMQYISYSPLEYENICSGGEGLLLFISKRAKNNTAIEAIVNKAKAGAEGYHIVGFIETGNIVVIVKDMQ